MVKHLPEAPSWPYIFAVELDIVGWNASVSSPGISKIGRQKKKGQQNPKIITMNHVRF